MEVCDQPLGGDQGSVQTGRDAGFRLEARLQNSSPTGPSCTGQRGSTWQRCASPGCTSDDRRVRLMAGPECENDVGSRFTLWPSRDSHVTSCLSAGAVTSYASAARSVSAARAAPTGTGATPQSEGLVRVRTQVCFHTPAPVPWGRSRSINPYAGRRFERRFEAADHPFADRPAVWQPGITEQGRGTPDGSGHSPSRQVRDAPVPGDRWPSRTGLLDRSDLPTEGGWACTCQPSPMPYQASRRGGRSRHGRTLRNGIAGPAAVVQPQRGQRHAEAGSSAMS